MAGALEVVVGRPAVVSKRAAVSDAKKPLGRLVTAGGIDEVSRGPAGNEDMQPSKQPADAPAGLIGHDSGRATHGSTNGLVDRLARSPGTQQDMSGPAARQCDAEEVAQDSRDFAMRQASVLIQFDNGGLSVGAELGCGGPERIGGLQRMSTLHTLPATIAPA